MIRLITIIEWLLYVGYTWTKISGCLTINTRKFLSTNLTEPKISMHEQQSSQSELTDFIDFSVIIEHLVNLPLFSTVVPSNICMFLSCRPFVVITTLSTGLVDVEITSVSWLGQLTVGI